MTLATLPVFIKLQPISLKRHPVLNERWVHDRIVEEPAILGLGDLQVRDRERAQKAGGRLDLLLTDAEEERRYVTEIQLGETDESHIIRTIEYWDEEKKRLGSLYEHVAVIIAERITSRFFNVIGLFNAQIPLIAIQMTAFDCGDGKVGLTFIKVLDEANPVLEEEEAELQEPVNREYWERQGSKASLLIMDQCIELLKEVDPLIEPNYTKRYVGLSREGQVNNFASFHPKKTFLVCSAKLENDQELDAELENAGIEFTYKPRKNKYRLVLRDDDVSAKRT